MPCGGFERQWNALCEREREVKGLKKGGDLLGEGQVECFHTCQDGVALVAAVSARLHAL